MTEYSYVNIAQDFMEDVFIKSRSQLLLSSLAASLFLLVYGTARSQRRRGPLPPASTVYKGEKRNLSPPSLAMYIYGGKLNWFQTAVNENIIFVVPAGFALNDPICAYWQWTTKVNVCSSGVIDSVTNTGGKYQVNISFGQFLFNIIVASDFETLTVTMRNPKGDHSKPMPLDRQYGNFGEVPSTSVYTGKLNWLKNAQNEMITLVIPVDISNGAHVGLYYEWTVDSAGVKKKNHYINTIFREVTTLPNGDVKGTFDDGVYTFEVTMHDDQQVTALIVRFSAGTDHGTPLVQDMLTKHLGFAQSDVEVYFLDLSKQGASGQDPPAVATFKIKFTALLTGASAGDATS
uniref:Uncharacterized protein n=1 Tax=Moniliophthora roreri TaxID=221103 RepID=A0A0W0FRH0_MONRR